MNYGVTDTGFQYKDFGTLKTEFFSRLSTALGGDIDTEADGPIGQVGGVSAMSDTELWEIAQSVVASLDPNSATGASLVRAVAYNGLTAKPATQTVVDAVISASEGTILASGSEISQINTGKKFQTSVATTVTKASVLKYQYKVNSGFSVGATIGFSVVHQTQGTTAATVTTISGDSQTTVGSKLASILQTNGVLTDTGIVEQDSSDPTLFTVTVTNPFRTVGITSVTGVTLTQIWTPATFTAVDTGAIVVPKNTLLGVTGGVSVDNLISGQVGRDSETSSELRKRREISLQMAGGCTIPSIASKMLENVRNISTVKVFENTSDFVDVWGRPPHSVHCVVEGGVSSEIANSIYTTGVCAGITTHGNVATTVTDSIGGTRTIKFDRPNIMYGWVKVIINAKNREESYPDDDINRIRQAILAFAVTTVGIGVDIVAQKFIGPVYSAITGLSNIEIQVAVTSSPDIDPSVPQGNSSVFGGTYSSGWSNDVVQVPPFCRVEWRDATYTNKIRILVENKTE